jgi:hypothetical protein
MSEVIDDQTAVYVTVGYDDDMSLIRNSLGYSYPAIPANIYEAINALGTQPGTVLLPGIGFTIPNTINIPANVTLDMQGATLAPSGNFDIITLSKGSQIRNGTIDVSSMTSFSKSCILLHGNKQILFEPTMIDNIFMKSAGQRGKGIYFVCDGANQSIQFVRCSNIDTRRFKYGIHMDAKVAGNGSKINGNVFTNWIGVEDYYGLTMEKNSSTTATVDGNMFTHMVCEFGTNGSSQPTVRGIYCEGERNIWNSLIIWDAGSMEKVNLTNKNGNYMITGEYASDNPIHNYGANHIFFYTADGTIRATTYTH